jgi:hypothetical protein
MSQETPEARTRRESITLALIAARWDELPHFYSEEEHGPAGRIIPLARQILNDLLDKYSAYGMAQFTIPDILKLPPLSSRGNLREITAAFNGPPKLRAAAAGGGDGLPGDGQPDDQRLPAAGCGQQDR